MDFPRRHPRRHAHTSTLSCVAPPTPPHSATPGTSSCRHLHTQPPCPTHTSTFGHNWRFARPTLPHSDTSGASSCPHLHTQPHLARRHAALNDLWVDAQEVIHQPLQRHRAVRHMVIWPGVDACPRDVGDGRLRVQVGVYAGLKVWAQYDIWSSGGVLMPAPVM